MYRLGFDKLENYIMRLFDCNLILVVIVMVLGVSICSAAPFDNAVMRVTFDSDSVDDITTGNVTTGTATNITFGDVIAMPNGTGRGAIFNGSTSAINYGLGAGNELKIEGASTHHIRVRFNATTASNNEEWLMGRFGNSLEENKRVWYIDAYGGKVLATVSSNGTGSAGSSADFRAIDGVFYDVYLRFEPVSDTDGFIKVDVYDAETGARKASETVFTATDQLYDSSDIDFWVGYRGDYSSTIPFDGVVEQVNVWDRSLADSELDTISGYVSSFDRAIFRVTFDANDVNDITAGDISVGVATDVNFIDVPVMANGNSTGAVFNGSTSGINYDLGANDELKIEGALTYHARVKYDSTTGERFIMGRFGATAGLPNARVSVLQDYGGDGQPKGYVAPFNSATASYGNACPENTVTSGVFYDIFLRCRPQIGTYNGYITTTVYNAQTGAFVEQSDDRVFGSASLYNSTFVKFWIGMRGDYTSTIPFSGIIEQVSVWNEDLSSFEMQQIAGNWIMQCGDIGTIYSRADFDRNCIVDISDLAVFINEWLMTY